MFLFDMPLEELRTCRLPQTREPDFDTFWVRMLARSTEQPLDPRSEPMTYPVSEVRVETISYAAFDGGRIAGWLLTPAEAAPRPTLVFFHGYGGDKRHVANYLSWALQGFTCITLDVRGQLGDSSDLADYPGGHSAGYMTNGILEPESYYFVRCFIDAV